MGRIRVWRRYDAGKKWVGHGNDFDGGFGLPGTASLGERFVPCLFARSEAHENIRKVVADIEPEGAVVEHPIRVRDPRSRLPVAPGFTPQPGLLHIFDRVEGGLPLAGGLIRAAGINPMPDDFPASFFTGFVELREKADLRTRPAPRPRNRDLTVDDWEAHG